jgi:hypothetical protein
MPHKKVRNFRQWLSVKTSLFVSSKVAQLARQLLHSIVYLFFPPTHPVFARAQSTVESGLQDFWQSSFGTAAVSLGKIMDLAVCFLVLSVEESLSVSDKLFSEPRGSQTGASTRYPFEQRGRGPVIDISTVSQGDY